MYGRFSMTYWLQVLLKSVLDDNAPVKSKTGNQVLFMNSELRKAMNQRDMWRIKHFKNKDKKLRIKYVHGDIVPQIYMKIRFRNTLTKNAIKAMVTKNFYDTTRPFLSAKCSRHSGSTIILRKNNDILTNPGKIAEMFYDIFASISEDKNEPGHLAECDLQFDFSPISEKDIFRDMWDIENCKTARHAAFRWNML